MRYRSTRSLDKANTVSASEAIFRGLAEDGGLYVPETWPVLPRSLEEYSLLSYPELAKEILSLYLTDFSEEEISACVESAYGSKFDVPEIVPITELDGRYFTELYHGPTIAFKDMALTLLPSLLTTAASHLDTGSRPEIVILTATSGDTGKAALAGFADVPGTRIMVYYPEDGVSDIQKLQMMTQKGKNVEVMGVAGNFDDCQNAVKRLFSDADLRERMAEKGYCFSSANSINIGRLLPQVVYYIYSYAHLLREGRIREGDPLNFVVPTGNFGNILAAYYAGRMGLPIHKLICASNANHVLTDFFMTGTYDRNRAFELTISPSMDILISSNLERLLYHAAGEDGARIRGMMQDLTEKGSYAVDEAMRGAMADFAAGYATEEDTKRAIAEVFGSSGYLLDPHTAVAEAVYQDYRSKTGDETPTVIISTASPYKFSASVLEAIGEEVPAEPFAAEAKLEEVSRIPAPAAVRELKGAPVLHPGTCSRQEMKQKLLEFLGMA